MSHVLIVEDDPVLNEAIEEIVTMAGHKSLQATNFQEALSHIELHHPALILSDTDIDRSHGKLLLQEVQKRAPGTPVIFMTNRGSIEGAVMAMRQGAVDYLQKPFSAQTLQEKIHPFIRLELSQDTGDPVAQDAKSQALLSMALKVAHFDVGVLISGESGTGKEVLAHYIHDHSPRKKHPFIAINCAAIPEQMLEATLFGYEKGAFTGAFKSTPGKFELAQGGTLLLDEVSEMSLALQAKLLRVLQEKEVERIGANKMISLNVRILATTNRRLQDEIAAGRFREDLYYRLNIFSLQWLPLRERSKDIIPLANYLLRKHCKTNMHLPQISPAAEQTMLQYPWPGNARELDNVMQRALVLQINGLIEPEHLMLDMIGQTCQLATTPNNVGNKGLQHNEYAYIEQTLKENQGNREAVAALLGVSERTLRYKLAKMREEGYVI